MSASEYDKDFSRILRMNPDLPHTIVEAFDAAAARLPGKEAVVEAQDRIGYGELRQRGEACARALAAAGIGKGDHVAVCLGNGPDWVIAFYGTLRAGGVCVPVNTRLRDEEIKYQLKQSDARLLFIAPSLLSIDFIGLLRGICPEIDRALPGPSLPLLRQVVVMGDSAPAACGTLADFLAAGQGHPLPPPPEPGDDALIQYTSGTTSMPKGVRLTHRSMVTDAYFCGRQIGIRPDDRYLSARPFFHVAGSTLSVVMSAVYSITLVTMKRFQAEQALRLMVEERCTLTSGNDTMYLMMLNSPDFVAHSYVLRGGWAAVSPSILRAIATRFGADRTVCAYGLSESSPNVAMSDHADPIDVRVDGWMRPHPGLDVRIVDPFTETEQPRGCQGEIRVRGWSVMRGYYNDPGATAEALDRHGFLKTGDIGVMNAGGAIRFVGRLKEIIRVGGENVSPADIENAFHEHPKVKQAVAFALPDGRLVEVPGLYVIPREGQTVSPDELLDWAKPRLASFKLPRHIAVMDDFEAIGMTASAKVQKRLLIEHAIRHFGLDEEAAE